MVWRKEKTRAKTETMTEADIIQYLPYLTSSANPITKWLNGDTAKFVYDHLFNVDTVSRLGTSLFRFNDNPEVLNLIISKLHDSLEELASKINHSSPTDGLVFIQQLSMVLGQENIFKGKFGEFYEAVDNDVLDVTQFFQPPMGSEVLATELRDEYMAYFQKAVREGTIHPVSVGFYTEQLVNDIQNQPENEENKALLQELSVPLMERTNCPIETMRLLQEAGIDVKEAREVMNDRIEAVVREISEQNTTLRDVLGERAEDDKQDDPNTIKPLTIDEKILAIAMGEVIRNEGAELADVKYLSRGAYSKVFQVGSKIIKFGNTPLTYHIPKNCKRFIQPLMRYVGEDEKKGPYIEITEECDTHFEFPNQQEEEEALYQVYRDIREEGMVWTDVGRRNVGMLKKDNSPHFEGIDHVDKAFLGFRDGADVEVLGPGELVVLDLDYIFDENDPAMKGQTPLAKAFEERYQKEKREKEQAKSKELGKDTMENKKKSNDSLDEI